MEKVRHRKALSKRSLIKRNGVGFTLIELLVVITILGIITTVILVFVKPQELQKRARDTNRMTDLGTLNNVISTAAQEAANSGAALFCNGASAPCSGRSTDTGANLRKLDGTGWVKINLNNQKSASLPTLPIDPVNNSTYHYTYCSDGNTWELDTVLESQTFAANMINDGGDENDKYEVGPTLTLINPTGSCQY